MINNNNIKNTIQYISQSILITLWQSIIFYAFKINKLVILHLQNLNIQKNLKM